MELKLEGKRALVSGSTAGIGWAIAAGLAAEGAEVVVNGRTQARVDARGAIRDRHPRATVRGVAADLGTARAVPGFAQAFPEVDILVNNLGIFEPKPFPEIPDEDWLRFFEVNVLSGVRLSRHYLPGMLQRNWGRIVFISSESAREDPGGDDPLRHDQDRPARRGPGAGRDAAGTGVTVNSVLPGPTRSEGVGKFVEDLAAAAGRSTAELVEAEFFKTARPTSLIQRFGTIEEVANMIAFVSSPLASATNGASVRVDGGVVPGDRRGGPRVWSAGLGLALVVQC